MLASEDPFYRDLGAKLAVGMPLRDIATSGLDHPPRDSQAADDEKANRSIRRLQEIGVGVVAPVDALAATPVDERRSPLVAGEGGAGRHGDDARRAPRAGAVVIDGTESEEEIVAALATRAR